MIEVYSDRDIARVFNTHWQDKTISIDNLQAFAKYWNFSIDVMEENDNGNTEIHIHF